MEEPEIDGVRIPSPMTMAVPIMAKSKSTTRATELLSSFCFNLWASFTFVDGISSL